jgi:hypothetical protein
MLSRATSSIRASVSRTLATGVAARGVHVQPPLPYALDALQPVFTEGVRSVYLFMSVCALYELFFYHTVR